MSELRSLDEELPDLPGWDVARYAEWEDDVARPALEAKGWSVGVWVTLEGDSFGPLIRGVTCTKHGQRVRFWYG